MPTILFLIQSRFLPQRTAALWHARLRFDMLTSIRCIAFEAASFGVAAIFVSIGFPHDPYIG